MARLFSFSSVLVVVALFGMIRVQALQAQQSKPNKDNDGNQLAVKSGDRIVFFGDSITREGALDGGYIRRFEQAMKKAMPKAEIEIVGAGIGGHKVPDLQKRIDRDVISKQPSIVVIYIGINDVWHSLKGNGTSAEDFETGLHDLIERCHAAKSKVLLCTPSVIGEKKQAANNLDKMLDQYSEISRNVAREKEIELLDLRQLFKQRLDAINPKNQARGILTRDRVHLNEAGNEFVAQQMLAALRVPISDAQPNRTIVYKKIGDVELRMHLFEPQDDGQKTDRPAAVFFFGGGWVSGTPKQFFPHCKHLADRGIVAMSAEYRIRSKHKTTPFECVKDGKSAVRWIREHAKELRIDPNRVMAGGGSAGGHVAAATGTVPGLNEPGEDTSISARPNALLLFNPVYDNGPGPGGWGHGAVKKRYQEISPMHNIDANTPPVIVFLGTKDRLIPVKTARKFQMKMRESGQTSVLKLYPGRGHGFFNASKNGAQEYRRTIIQLDDFLNLLGY